MSVERLQPLPRLATCRDIVFINESPAVFEIIETTRHCAAGERNSVRLRSEGTDEQGTLDPLNRYIILYSGVLLFITTLSTHNSFTKLKPSALMLFYIECSE